MFRLHTSNDAARLADALAARVCAPRGNPLTPARVLVPQSGLARWLQVHFAERCGIVANVEFTPPAQFAWELLHAAQPELPGQSPFEVEVLRWHLYALLGESLDGHALAPLREYLTADRDPLRRYALSLELARAFERMQGYRRDKLLAWERGAETNDWQAELWRRVLPRVGGTSRAARVDDWLARFDPDHPADTRADKPVPPGLPESFACFACANVSPDVLRMLAVAGRHCDVDFYLPLPSMEYLGDVPRTRAAVRARLGERAGENPLVLSLGGALSGFVNLLFDYQHVQPDVEHDDYDAAIPCTTLLGRVRDDILHHVEPAAAGRASLPDASLQFHACHTPLREVQTLHDALLAMLDADPTLQPRDVVVMLPDVAAYAPAITAVFGGMARDDPRWLPFNLGDAGAAALHPVAQLFLDLLDAPASRWDASELLDLLSVPGVLRRFDLDADAVARLAQRLREAGVRWGEDERARADCGDYREFSWAFGIERVLAGFAGGDDAGELMGDTAPLAGVEGAAFAHLDAVLAVLEAWRRLRDAAPNARAAAEWQAFLNARLDDIYQPDPRDTAETRALERIRDVLAALARDCTTAAAGALPWTDVRAFLREALAAPDPRQYLFTGGITFCGMVPLRVVPFRVICLLGMDEAAFPRRESNGLDPLLADRRAGIAEKGDRDLRADDRLLFLQLLAAARDAFYVSWIGRDVHSNEALPPSVVVSELQDMVRDHYLLPPADEDESRRQQKMLPQVAPLHPFDRALFAQNPADACSFHAEWRPAANARRRGADALPPFAGVPLSAPAEPARAVTLAELKRFFDDPARGYLQGGLQLRLPRDAEEDADLEPLQPDHPLLRYDLANALLAGGTTVAGDEKNLLRAQGRLPPGGLGDAALAIARDRADTLRAAIDRFTRGESCLDDITASVELDDGTTVAGTVPEFYAAGLVRCAPAGLSGKRLLRAWLDTLFAATATRAGVTCRILWLDGAAVEARDLMIRDPAEACAELASMVNAWRTGQRQPLPLFPEAALVAFNELGRKKPDASEDEARDFFMAKLAEMAGKLDDDNDFGSARDFDKPSVRLAWRGIAIDPSDIALATRLYDTAAALFPALHPVPEQP